MQVGWAGGCQRCMILGAGPARTLFFPLFKEGFGAVECGLNAGHDVLFSNAVQEVLAMHEL